MKVFITGGTGYVGNGVVNLLLDRGHEAVCLVRAGSEKKLGDLIDRVKVVNGDILDSSFIGLTGCDTVIHLVAIIKEIPDQGITFEKLIFESAKNMIDRAKECGVDRFILMSAVGSPPGIPSGYYKYKVQAEDYLKNSGLKYTIFKPSLIFERSWWGKSVGWIVLFNWLFSFGGLFPVVGDWIKKWQPIPRSRIANAFVYAVENKVCIDKTISGRKLFDIA